MSLNDIWWRSPPKIINSLFIITELCPSLAQGFLPTIKFELFERGAKNLDTDSLPKSVNLPYGILILGSGFPITSNEFFIAWEDVSNFTYLVFSSFDV